MAAPAPDTVESGAATEVDETTETTTTRTASGHVWERSRRSVAWPLAVGVAGLAALGIGQAWPNRHSIEGDLGDRSASALASAGVPSVSVTFAGRDGTVRGVVDTDADRRKVLDLVRTQQGVRVALDRLTVRTPSTTPTSTGPVATTSTPVPPTSAPATSTPPVATSTAVPPTSAPPTSAPPTSSGSGVVTPALTLTIGPTGAVLTGALPDDATRASLLAAASALVGEGKVTDKLTVDPRVAPDGLSSLGGVLAGLGADADVTVTLADGTIALDGTVGAPEARQAALTAAESVVGTAAKVRDGLTVRADNPVKDQQDAVRAAIAELPRVTFATGSARLTPAGRKTVENVAEILDAYPKVAVQVQGHTDSQGAAGLNQSLSVARAKSVVAALRALGVKNPLSAKGFGETKPAFPNTTPTNRAKNRRVVFEVLA